VRDESVEPKENEMKTSMILRSLSGLALVAGLWGAVELSEGPQRAFAQEKKNALEKKGTVVGVVTDRKEKGWLEIKADGEEKGRRYFRFGNRPEVNKTIDPVRIGDRVRVEWESRSEGPHIAGVEVLKKSADPK
jgi:hypothetical protein